MALIIAVIGFLACLLLLAKVSEYFIRALSSLARRYRIPQSVAGATLAAIGSSAPELFSSLAAVRQSVPNVGVGTITGSAIFNILVIVGLSALVGKCRVMPRVVSRDGITYFLALVTLIAVIWDRTIYRWEAILLMICYFFYFGVLVRDIKKHPEQLPPDESAGLPLKQGQAWMIMVAGIFAFGVICHYLIIFTLDLGHALNMSPVVMGLLANAVGTSVPDLLASIAAVRLGMGSLAISNAVGSNIFDIWFCIGGPLALRQATPVVGEVLNSVPFLFGSFIATLFMIRTDWMVTKREGYILLGLYAVFVVYTLYQALT